MKEKDYITTMPIPEAVDLGLPSGIKWASFNLGASKPEEYGYYYGWGCTEPYADDEDVDWTPYIEKLGGTGAGESDYGTEKDPLKDYVDPNDKSIAGTKWDVARQKLGGAWRMPTVNEIIELLNKDNCDWQWTTENGVNGYKVTSTKNGNSIFLPAAGNRDGTSLRRAGSDGNYWSSSPFPYFRCHAYHLDFSSDLYGCYGGIGRFFGFPMRPVSE